MKIKIITYGCSNNQAESEIIAGLLKEDGHQLVDNNEDLIIINSCAVKGPTEQKILNKIKKTHKPLIVMGCLVNYNPNAIKKANPNAILVKTHDFNNIKKIIKGKRESNNYVPKRIGYPRVRINPTIAIVPISSGCLGNCTYCCVKNIKGKLVSFSEEDIIKEIHHALNDGVKEIWITSQDNGCYGLDIRTNIFSLLKKIAQIKGEFWVRIGMMNPQWLKKDVYKLINILKNDRFYKFVHIPVQSGSNKILKLMNRSYTVEEFMKIVQTLKENIPNISISTDVIVGFPRETEEDFKKTIELIKQIEPEILNISRYWIRKNTDAAKMKQIPTNKIKERSIILTKIYKEIAKKQNKKWLGWEGDVLVNDYNKGRNIYYKSIHIESNPGEFKKIKVTKVKTHYLIGKL